MPLKNLYAAAAKRPYQYGALLLLIIFGGWYFFGRTTSQTLDTITLAPGDFITQINVSGTVIAAQDVDLGFNQSGRVTSLSAMVGQKVARGTVLATIENGDQRAAIEQKRAIVAQQQAKLSALKGGTRPEQLALKEAAVTSATISLQNALVDGYRSADDAVHNKTVSLFINASTQPQLVFSPSNSQLKIRIENERKDLQAALSAAQGSAEQGVIRALLSLVAAHLTDLSTALASASTNANFSQADVDAAVSAVGSARSSVNASVSAIASAAAALDNAQRDLTLAQAGSTAADIDAQAAQVDAAVADVAAAQAQLQKTLITAPFSGIVTKIDTLVGQLVSANTPVVSMVSDGAFQIVSFVPEVSVAQVSMGNPATVTLDAYGPSVTFSARVVAIELARTIRDGISTYKTTLQFDERDPRIRSGMTADTRIRTQEKQGALSVPRSAIYTKEGQPFVQVMAGKTAEERTVTLGMESLSQVEILSGLKSGEKVVLNPTP